MIAGKIFVLLSKQKSVMAYYYKLEDCLSTSPCSKDLFKVTFPEADTSDDGPCIKYNFSKYVLIEFIDDVTPAKELWNQLGLMKNKEVIHKRLMWDPHRLKCRRAVVICKTSEGAIQIAANIKGKRFINRQLCAVVIEELINDICLFEKQIKRYGDLRTQEKLVYVSNLSPLRGQSALVQFLREKFSPFGSILSILLSTGDDDLALGEAVIRFAYFSEAFASELALDEFVIGKERLHVTMQHNVLLSQCDLRVRLRDSLNEYHEKTAVQLAAKRFKSDIYYKTVELHGGCDNSSNTDIDLHPSNNDISHCEFRSPTQDLHKHIDMHTGNIMENVEQTPMEDNDTVRHCGNKRSFDECVLETTMEEDIFSNSLQRTVALLDRPENASSQVGNSSTSDQSVSSKIFGWMKSLVWKSNPETSTMPRNKDSNSSTASGLLEDLQVSDCCNKLPLITNEKNSDSSFTTVFKTKANSAEIGSEPNRQLISEVCPQNERIIDQNPENLALVDSRACDYQTKVCTSKRKSKISTSRKKGSYCSDNAENEITIGKKMSQGNNEMPLYQIIKESADESSSGTTYCNDQMLQHNKLPLPQKKLLLTSNMNIYPSISRLERNANFSRSGEKSKIVDTERTTIPCSETLDSFEVKKSKLPADSAKLQYSIKKNSPRVPATLHLTGCFSDIKENVAEFTCQPQKQSSSRIIHSTDVVSKNDVIKDWLKKHLNETTNNRMTATKEKPEGIVFATMSKDVLVAVGCSHMTCDTCYPSASDLIYGL